MQIPSWPLLKDQEESALVRRRSTNPQHEARLDQKSMWRPDLYAGPESRVCSECEGFEAVNASPAYTSAAFGKPTTLDALPDYADFTATLSLLALLLDYVSV
jgi:hypothetical protein